MDNRIKHFDAIIIGAGSGLTISSEAAEKGLKTAIIEKSTFGGTCLNRGCIPSKMFIHTADLANEIKKAEKFGIKAKINKIDWKAIQNRVWKHIDPDAKAIEKGNKSNKNITVFNGEAKFIDNKTIKVNNQTLTAKKIFICAGTRPSVPKIEGLEKIKYHTSDDIMRLKQQPKSIMIIGGGYIAAEMANFFSGIGTNTYLAYRGDVLLNREDSEIAKTFIELAKKQYNVLLNADPVKFSQKGKKIQTLLNINGKNKTITTDVLLMATGRAPNTDLLNIQNTKIKTSHGYIQINPYTETSVKDVYAIGDIAGVYLFKHSANLEAQYSANNAFNKNKIKVDYNAMPHAIFTSPQIAGVGLTEDELKEKKIKYSKGTYRYYNTGMGIALEEKDGFVKVLVDPKTDKILGCHIIGPEASTLIHEVLVAMRSNLNASAIRKTIHIHPALNEVLQRAFNNI